LKKAFCFIATEDYLEGLKVLLYSLSLNFKNYNQYDKIVYSTSDVQINGVINKLIKGDLPPYYWKFNLFMEDYDRIIWMDSDMLCINDFSYIDNMDIQLGVCHSKTNVNNGMFSPVNAGFLIFGKQYLTEKWHSIFANDIRKKDMTSCFDQETVGRVLRGQKCTYLSRDLNEEEFEKINDKTCILHWAKYYLLKPWVKDIGLFLKNKPWLDGHIDSKLMEKEQKLYIKLTQNLKTGPNDIWNKYHDEMKGMSQ